MQCAALVLTIIFTILIYYIIIKINIIDGRNIAHLQLTLKLIFINYKFTSMYIIMFYVNNNANKTYIETLN